MYYYQKILFQHHQAVSMCISVCLPQKTLWKWNNRETKMGRGSQKNSDLEEMIEPLFDDKIGCQVHNPQCSYEHRLSHSDIGNVFISYLKLLLKVRRNFTLFSFAKLSFQNHWFIQVVAKLMVKERLLFCNQGSDSSVRIYHSYSI